MSAMCIPGFAGAFRDSVTCAVPLGNGYRWYLPSLMRFNAPDSLSPFDVGGINFYVYCGTDPINRTDPTGHMFEAIEHLPDWLEKSVLRNASASLPELTADEVDSTFDAMSHPIGTRRPASDMPEGSASKRPRVEERGEPGPRHQADAPSRPTFGREQVGAALNRLEHNVETNLKPTFHSGRPSLVKLWMKRRFSEINAAIDGMEDIPDNVIIDRLNHLRNIEPHIDPRWGDLRGQANRIGRKLDAYLRISTDASRISDVHSDSDSDSEEIPLFSAAPQLLREWGQ